MKKVIKRIIFLLTRAYLYVKIGLSKARERIATLQRKKKKKIKKVETMKTIREMTTKEQIKVFLNALFGGLVAGCIGWFIGGFGWSYELQGYIFDHIAGFNCAFTFGLVIFLAVITSAIFQEKEQETEYIPGVFNRKKDNKR